MSKALVCAVLCAIGSTLVRAEGVELSERAAAEPYAPFSVPCAVRPAVRPATGLGHKESSYVEARQTLATQQLVSWLDKTFNGSASWEECELPRIAIALSGGGPKAGLTTAGVVQAFDSRDSSFGISGILQSSTYLSALSGGSLTLSGLMVNDFPKISVLKESLYDLNYQNPFLLPLQNPEQIVSITTSTKMGSKADCSRKRMSMLRTTPAIAPRSSTNMAVQSRTTSLEDLRVAMAFDGAM